MLEKALVDSIGAFFGMIKVYAKKVFNRLIIEEIMKTLRFTSWVILLFLFSSVVTFTQSDNQLFTIEETSYLEANKNQIITVGLDPLSGMDYFLMENGQAAGVVLEVFKLIERDTGLQFKLVTDQTWNQVYEGLQTGEIDILFGANETEERLKTMAFTKPLYQHPYAIFTHENTEMFTIGDLDKRVVGFMEGDFVVDALMKKYIYLSYEPVYYGNQTDLIEGLIEGKIDAAVFSGGSIIYKFLQEYPDMKYVAPIESIVSDLTLSVRKDQQVMWSILNKEIGHLISTGDIDKSIQKSEVSFIREIIGLTDSERQWLESGQPVAIGVTQDYLPIDYYEENQYLGVSGAILTEIARITGLNVDYVYSDFNTLHNRLINGGVDVLNIVRTDEREEYLNFTIPYSYERDIIVGLKSAEEVLDVYGLEGKRVAVVDGFWHDDYLRKNLVSVDIIKTLDIEDSMKSVLDGQADYFIENPTVVKFYIAVNEYYDLVEKGVTSSDSYLYYGISKRMPELHGIINKTLPIIDVRSLQREGYQSVPLIIDNSREVKLRLIIFLLIVALAFIVIRLKRALDDLISERAMTEVYKERQILEYTDVMTGLKNRNYYYKEIEAQINEDGQMLGVLMCDVDRLKYVNDTYGHPVGDQLIVEVAKLLRRVVGEEGSPIRMGGDEFLVLLPSYTEKQCMETQYRIEEEINALSIETAEGVKIDIALSTGYAVRANETETLEHVILRADNDMYMNKRRRWSM